jgi:O-antigen ligase
VLWHVGATYSAGLILARRQPLSRDRHIAVLTAFAYIYVACGIISAVANSISAAELPKLLPLATFLLFPFSYSAWSLSDKRTIARACFIGSMIACYGALVLAPIQFHILGIRAEGGAGNALVFSQVVAMAGTICLAAALSVGNKMAIPLLGAFLASLVALVYAESRTIWLSALCSIALVLWIYRGRLAHIVSRRMVLGVAVILAIITVASFNLVAVRFQEMFHDLNHAFVHSNYETPVGQRLALWQIGLHLVQDRPILGYGIQSTHQLVHHGLQTGYGIPFEYSHFHNGILTLLVETGIVGALAVLAIFLAAAFYAGRVLRRSDDEIERFGATVLASFVCLYLLSSMTNLLVGNDIIDATLMIFLTIGSYLAVGTSMLPRKPGSLAPSSD